MFTQVEAGSVQNISALSHEEIEQVSGGAYVWQKVEVYSNGVYQGYYYRQIEVTAVEAVEFNTTHT